MKSALSFLSLLLLAVLLNGCDTIVPADLKQPTATKAAPLTGPAFTPTPRPPVTVDPEGCIEQACILDGHFLLQNPIPPDANQGVDGTYRFGTTQEGVLGIHYGVEFENPTGTPVLSAADGKVVFAGDDAVTILGSGQNFYGNVVVIEHHLSGIDQPLFTLYAHLSEISVASDNQVTAGQMIGKVGRSGSALGSHLHFEVRLGENKYEAAVNPELWLMTASESGGINNGALAGIIQDEQGEPERVTNIRLEYSPVEGGAAEKYYSFSTYFDDRAASDPSFGENFTIGALTPGWYRFITIANGLYISEWVLVESGKLTFLAIPFK